MPKKIMFNYLELAYSPIGNYEYALIKDDELFQELTKDCTLYIITQRNELTFENLYFVADPKQVFVHFEIRQKGNSSNLKCIIPVYQENIAKDSGREIKFHFEYALPKPFPLPKTFPQHNIRNLLFSYHDGTFISWLSPENVLQNYLNGAIEGQIKGQIGDFLNYKVHYVGKAVEQKVWQRLKGHSTLQEILSLEYPEISGTLPTHEIAILFFKFKDAIGVHTISHRQEITNDVIDSILGRNFPSESTISKDAEKALINAMQPKYNKEFYRNYPRSKDGLYKYDLDTYSFQIRSNIILRYENGAIIGRPGLNADSIIVERDKPLRVVNH